jgi:hypothetical protein
MRDAALSQKQLLNLQDTGTLNFVILKAIEKSLLTIHSGRIYTPAKIYIRLYKYEYGDKFFIHP